MAPPVNGVAEVALYVDDVPRAVEFYQRVLGFASVAVDERITAVQAGERQMLLLCHRGAAEDHDGQGRQHVAFAIPPEQMDAWKIWLPEHGVVIERQKSWQWGGESIYFRDPDGHLLELATPGVWPTVY
jgi:catechol 2,3-dioxygenase-like lactoylglutathione lyase family enzyme